jgi:hypothetical protein
MDLGTEPGLGVPLVRAGLCETGAVWPGPEQATVRNAIVISVATFNLLCPFPVQQQEQLDRLLRVAI